MRLCRATAADNDGKFVLKVISLERVAFHFTFRGREYMMLCLCLSLSLALALCERTLVHLLLA